MCILHICRFGQLLRAISQRDPSSPFAGFGVITRPFKFGFGSGGCLIEGASADCMVGNGVDYCSLCVFDIRALIIRVGFGVIIL